MIGKARYFLNNCQRTLLGSIAPKEDTHRCMRDEVGELDDVPSVGIHERLVPHRLTVVPDLYNVREGNRAVLLRDVFDLRRVPVVRPPEPTFSLGDRVGGGDRGGGRGDVGRG